MADYYLKSCAACRYWTGWRNWTATGDCRRHAPNRRGVEFLPGGGLVQRSACWPETTSVHWCGDWEKAELTDQEAQRLGEMLVSRP